MTTSVSLPLTAMGVPIVSMPRPSTSSNGDRAMTNLRRLLYSLEEQLREEVYVAQKDDPWHAAGIAMALTHANSALSSAQRAQNGTADLSVLRTRLRAATQRYVQLYPLQMQQSNAQASNVRTQNPIVSKRFDAREYLMEDLMHGSDSDSEFDEQVEQEEHDAEALDGQEKALGGVAEKGNVVDEDDIANEYEKATSLRRRTGENVVTSKEKGNDGTDDATPPTALQSERTIQDSLSSELLRMAGILKTNSIKFADALERDRKILEEADEKLQGNLSLMTRTSGKLGEYSRKARSMGWLTLGAVAMVCISWVVMFVLIRLT